MEEEEKKEKIDVVEEISTIFWVFMIGSFLGYIFEMIIVIFQKGHFESRQGLIYGPLTPVYGIGGVIYYLAFKIIKTRDKGKVFLISMVLGGVTEYLCSFIQERVFHTISWDYSHLPFNFNGRTSLLHCSYWGIAGLLYIVYIEPIINKIGKMIKKNGIKIATSLVAVFMVWNITISWIAGVRQKDRMQNIAPRNKIEQFLDEHYPDEYMDKIFANKKNK